MNPLSKRQFSKAINDYKASIRVIIQDSNTPRNIKKKLDWQIKELKDVNFHGYYQKNNKRPLPSPHINVEDNNNNITNIANIKRLRLLVKPHVNNVLRHTPDASTIFHDDNYACINLDNYTYDDENKYEIEEVNVGKLFKKYQLEAAKQIKSKGCFLEADIQELLAINNILLIKSGQTSRLVSGVFSEACILSIQREIKQIFGIMDSTEVQTDVKIRIEKILKVGIRNLLEIIPKYKFNGLVKESQVGCSLIR
ncbi:hypothetical protein G6F57_012020 [Rhizopus arrhizus]|nr:hypothetical protein G6F33_011485 [Rhizopus arrhizus]KAG0930107.1 hypothetical protein G6F30_011757 [Rhizopus arrhizus]KAG0932126.1 hypothetical protein G6F32_011479 [Rhizopus arrhizus]KAG0982971.1 hypothetical protein G6F28_011066 [Rhizopus arrhizus]KAG0987917.1 hypothetical protein G6F29_002154 [Rhizopus arrhizus]